MKQIKTVRNLQLQLRYFKRGKKSIGFVPTMGALHEGHLSLIRKAKKENDIVVVSIFVNPLQFGPKEDFKKYPKPLQTDLKKCKEEGVDVVYSPSVDMMYGKACLTTIHVGELSDGLCGRSRKGHFDGVATVVAKLFNQVNPDRAYFGKKDFQQLRIIEQMVDDLDLSVRVCRCPIVREEDGLAMSSRNAYLSEKERERATALQRALKEVKGMIQAGKKDVSQLKRKLKTIISKDFTKFEYAEIVDAKTLKPIKALRGSILIAVCGRMGSARLIDNLEIRV